MEYVPKFFSTFFTFKSDWSCDGYTHSFYKIKSGVKMKEKNGKKAVQPNL